MADRWPSVPFGSLYLVPSRNGLTKPKRVRGKGYKFVNMGEIFAFERMLNIPCDRVPATEKELVTSTLEPGDLLFARQSLVLSGAGKCAVFLGDDETVVFESHLIRVRPDVAKVEPEYLFYFFNSPIGRGEIWAITEQGAGQAGIRGSDLESVQVTLPPLYDQRKIVEILGTLDDKIELNRQINTTLESMAQALFKSWFVDFDPVIDNALAAGNDIPDALQAKAAKRKALGDKRKSLPDDLQQQFPDRFVFTEEMGWVPEGWESTSLKSIVELAYGKSLPAKNRVEGDIPVYGSGGASGTHNEALVQGPSVVVGRKGTVGSLYWVDGPFYPIDTVFYVVPQRQGIPLYWIYQALQQIDIQSMGADSAVPGVNRNTLYSLGIVVPDLIVLERYWTILSGLVNKQQRIIEQNRSLAMLRDSLLPKLLSGELRIPEAEKQLVEAL